MIFQTYCMQGVNKDMVVALLKVATCFQRKGCQHMCGISLGFVIFTVRNTYGFCKYWVIQKQTLTCGRRL